MPVTKTAKRAIRGSKRKETVNTQLMGKLEMATRKAKKTGFKENINSAISFADKAAKKHLIHKNKAARIKSALSKLLTKKSLQSAPTKKAKKNKTKK